MRLRIALASALATLRAYPATAVLLGVTLLGGLIAAAPLAALFGRGHDPAGFRPVLSPVRGGDLGLRWPLGVRAPTLTQQEAVSTLGTVLLFVLLGAVIAGSVTLLSVGAARAAESRGDRMIRRAVGAGRHVLVCSATLEAMLIGGIPILVAIPIIWAMASQALTAWPGRIAGAGGAALPIAVIILLVLSVAMLLVPALSRPRGIPEAEIHGRLPTAPVVFQIAMSIAVLMGGSLLLNRSATLLPDPGPTSHSGSIFEISPATASAAERSTRYERLLNHLNDRGIRSASLTSPGTLSGLGHVAMVLTDCGQCAENGLALPWRLKPATHKIVSSDTFRLIDLPVVEGRGLRMTDDWSAPRVAVVSRSLAAREFQDGRPLGRRIHVGDDDAEGSTVVGVVDDRLATALGGSLQPHYAVYTSVLQHPPRTVDLLVRDPQPDPVLASALHDAFPEAGTGVVASSERTLQAREAAPVHWFGERLEFAGLIIAVLMVLGVAGYQRLWVESLVGEIGIRRSVGASRNRILRLVLAQALGVAFKGTVLGIWFGYALWAVLPTVVTGTAVWDLEQLLVYAGGFASIVVVSVFPAAWRATKVPVTALLVRPRRR
jgi:putative ABC transport system permease protein